MAKIIGNTTTTPMTVPDFAQTDERKADYIKNKPTILTEEDVLKLIGEHGYTPIRGTDYWTDEDKAEIKGYVDEAILGGAW